MRVVQPVIQPVFWKKKLAGKNWRENISTPTVKERIFLKSRRNKRNYDDGTEKRREKERYRRERLTKIWWM